MDKIFAVGEVAICQNIEGVFDWLNGNDCEVVAGLGLRRLTDLFGNKTYGVCYGVMVGDLRIAVTHDQLRKKKSPPPVREIDTPVSWDDCGWKPEQVAA
jgi:hypothetical protein